MADIGLTYIEFGSLTPNIVGGDFTLGRGSRPGVCRIRVADIDPIVETSPQTLTIKEDDRTLTLPNCTASASAMRLHNCNKDYPEWVVNVFDERAQFGRKTVCGEFNLRGLDNHVLTHRKKTGMELLTEIMSQVGATAELPTGTNLGSVYPSVNWDGRPWGECLDELCAKLGVHLAPKLDGTWKFYRTGEGDGLTADASTANINADSPATIDDGPKVVTVECDPTVFGCGLQLEAVGIEEDGQYHLLDELTYNPALAGRPGWPSNWPTLFSYVEPGARPLAFRSVYRTYRIKVPQTLPVKGPDDETLVLTNIDDIFLNDYRIAFDTDEDNPPYVTGTYWGFSDHYKNVANCPNLSMDFKIDKRNRVIIFEFPLFRVGNCILPADIKLFTSFTLRNSTGCFIKQTFTVTRNTGSGEKIFHLPDLWRAIALGYLNCDQVSVWDNIDDLTDEAEVYRDAYKAHYDSRTVKRQLEFPGVLKIMPNGKVSQVCFHINKGLPTTTVASENFDHNAMVR